MGGLDNVAMFSDQTPYHWKWQAFQRSTLAASQWCSYHERQCPYMAPIFDVSGPPCTDFSLSGKQLRWHGPTAGPTLAFFRKHALLQTPIVIVENVRSFPKSYIEVNLPEHCVYRQEVASSDSGFQLNRRSRAYYICLHAGRADMMLDWEDLYKRLSHAMYVDTKPHHAFLSTSHDVWTEELALAQRRDIPPCLQQPGFTTWYYLLTANEQARLYHYQHLQAMLHGSRRDRRDPLDSVYNLGDNPAVRLCWSVTSNCIPTYRRTATIMWIAGLCRGMTTQEKLATLGWPVFPQLANADLEHFCPAPDDGRHMLGNAMNLASVTTVLMSALACTRLRDPHGACQ